MKDDDGGWRGEVRWEERYSKQTEPESAHLNHFFIAGVESTEPGTVGGEAGAAQCESTLC